MKTIYVNGKPIQRENISQIKIQSENVKRILSGKLTSNK